MHALAIALVVCAAICYVGAACSRWWSMNRRVDEAERRGGPWVLALSLTGLILHTAALVLSLIEARHPDFLYGVIGSWACVATLFFIAGYLALPSRGLLLLPVGAMTLMVVLLTVPDRIAEGTSERDAGMSWITVLHIAFTASHLAAMWLAGSVAGLFLLAQRQLKSASARSFQLPSLAVLGRLTERAFMVSAALLVGALATGGAAMAIEQPEEPWRVLLHAAPGLVNLMLVLLALALWLPGHIRRTPFAWWIVLASLVTLSYSVGLWAVGAVDG